uniref:ATP synthase subunit a n=1 Tax=Tituria pyramidata TaxID=2713555 RepID=A0A6G6D483_9HEMI|nr:ATP synthase F0 subunit 6 [Tituria pyramidata]QIE11347.1 ATP synthase F0 subunit 6 [Tituria pyramidata]
MNLFTVFDPCTGFFSMNWFSIFVFLFVFPFGFWFCNGMLMVFFNMFLFGFYKEICNLTHYFNSILFLLSFFLYIMVINLIGLIPYVFTSSSHLVFSLGLSLPFWIGLMFFGWFNNSNFMFIHMVPMGTPYLLMPFMVLIETVSNLIRPFSLAVRLSANMIAGHLLMSLLGGSTCESLIFMFFFFFVFVSIFVFELAVSLIQSYVFMTLSVLYSSEV